MKQRRIRLVFTVILCILIIVPVYFRISQYLTIKNVYDERGAINTSFLGRGNVSLGKVDGIESWNRADAFDEKFPVSEKYDEKSLPTNMTNMSLSFFFSEKRLNISFGYVLSESVSIRFYNQYYVGKSELVRSIYFVDEQNKISEKNKIKEYLDKYNIDKDILEQFYKKGMDDILLKDWFSVHKSRFFFLKSRRINY
ncbi:hypothetical protein IGJ55_002452 [Enterococcus sp. AZ170]|uniref:TipC family immunity protein n=1 Tax=unclassified Enterococcus TaxID=2608891 RepID=UPI003D2E084E